MKRMPLRSRRLTGESTRLQDISWICFGCASLLTDELLELARVSMTLKVAIEYINTGARRFLDLNVSADHFMLEIAEENIKFASALNQGFYKLATNQLQIEKDIRTALDAKPRWTGCTTVLWHRSVQTVKRQDTRDPALDTRKRHLKCVPCLYAERLITLFSRAQKTRLDCQPTSINRILYGDPDLRNDTKRQL